MEKYGLTKVGIKSKKNADCFEYFFSVDDIAAKYRDFLNPDLEPVELIIETELSDEAMMPILKPEDNAQEIPIVITLIPDTPAEENIVFLPEITISPPSEEFEAPPPQKRTDSPVPSLEKLPQAGLTITVKVEEPPVEDTTEKTEKC